MANYDTENPLRLLLPNWSVSLIFGGIYLFAGKAIWAHASFYVCVLLALAFRSKLDAYIQSGGRNDAG